MLTPAFRSVRTASSGGRIDLATLGWAPQVPGSPIHQLAGFGANKATVIHPEQGWIGPCTWWQDPPITSKLLHSFLMGGGFVEVLGNMSWY